MIIKIYDALKIAVRMLESKHLMYSNNYKLVVTALEQEWVFWFIFLPQTPGLEITVFVANDGQTRYLAGM